jgi:hypothetical protein
MSHQDKPRALGVSGTILGLVALVVAVLHFYLGPIAEPVPVESFIAEKTMSIKNALNAKIKGEEYVAPKHMATFDPDLIVNNTSKLTPLAIKSPLQN